MTDFASVDLKLWRARQHLTEFEMVLSTYLQTNPISLVAQPQTDSVREAFNIRMTAPLPDLLGLIYGDFVHNVRTGLDHLVMALALDNGADPRDNSIQFPICNEPDRFFGSPGGKSHVRPKVPPRGTGGNNVVALRPNAQSFVEALQPYNVGDGAWTLAELQNLDNMDKHRNLIVGRIVPSIFMGFENGIEIEWASPVPDLKDGSYLATVIYPSGYNGAKVQPGLSAGIYVERFNPPIGILEAQPFGSNQLLPHVRGIVDEAKRLFP